MVGDYHRLIWWKIPCEFGTSIPPARWPTGWRPWRRASLLRCQRRYRWENQQIPWEQHFTYMKTAIKWSMVWYGIPNSCYIFCKHQILDIFGQTQMLSTALINALATVRPAQSRKTDWLGLLRCESCEPDFSQFGRARAWLARSFCTASHQWWQARPSLDCYASIAQTCEHWLAWWRKKNEVLVTVFNIDISSHIHFFGTQHPSDTFQIHFRHG